MRFAEKPVWALRPHAEWHIWGRERELFGKVYEAWHTIEGPFVVFRDGLYWMFYSGGSWETPNYGVSYAIAEHPLGPWRDEWSSQGPQVLKGVAPHAVGPGHNSIVKAPDGETDIMCYHAWDAAQTARRLCIDPIEWTPNGPRVLGPTWTPQAGEWLIGHRE
jgi:GH43 family beta-xylosidase